MTLSPEDEQLVDTYFRDWWTWVRLGAQTGEGRKKVWKQREPSPPIAAVQAAALGHPNAKVRRDCLGVLDHHANDESGVVFAAALSDPVPKVRVVALHGLSCERCRVEELCVADVVPALVQAATTDPSAKVRHGAVPILAMLAGRDERARDALVTMARDDSDEYVRRVASAAVDGRDREIRSRKAIRRRDARATALI